MWFQEAAAGTVQQMFGQNWMLEVPADLTKPESHQAPKEGRMSNVYKHGVNKSPGLCVKCNWNGSLFVLARPRMLCHAGCVFARENTVIFT